MKRWEKIIVFLIMPILGIAVWTAIFAERPWIQHTLIPAYTNATYARKVKSTFDEVFYPVNTKLGAYGFTQGTMLADGSCSKGYPPYFDGFLETMTCTRAETVELPRYTATFGTKWQANYGKSFNQYMLSQGWTRQPFFRLWAPPSDHEAFDLQYKTYRNGVRCGFVLTYSPKAKDSQKVWGMESCEKNFAPFKNANY